MANKTFVMTLNESLLESIKQKARERSVEERKDYTYQELLREIIMTHMGNKPIEVKR